MKWEQITLLREYDCGPDELGNPIPVLQPVYRSKARYTPAVDIDTAFDGRHDTVGVQYFTIPTRAESLPHFTHLEYKGETYKVLQVEELMRWAVAKGVIYETRTANRGL